MSEKSIQNAILSHFGRDPRLRLWRQNTGVAKHGDRTVRYGVPGAADLTGILATGQRLEIEVKSPTGRQDPKQKTYQAMIEKFGGLYILARSIQDVEEKL